MKKAQAELLDLNGIGLSILEISHRSKDFEAVINGAEAKIRSLLGVPENYSVMFLQGGASLQFGMLPMNLLIGKTGRLRQYRRLGKKGDQGSQAVRHRERHRQLRRQEFFLCAQRT